MCVNIASTVLRGLCVQSRYGTNIVALPEETGSNRENKPVPKAGETHFYSTFLQVYASFGVLRVCKLFNSKGIIEVVGRLTNFECLAPYAIKYKFYYFFFFIFFSLSDILIKKYMY